MAHLIRLFLIICCTSSAASRAAAQGSYPNKPVRLIVAFVAGGATTTLCTLVLVLPVMSAIDSLAVKVVSVVAV